MGFSELSGQKNIHQTRDDEIGIVCPVRNVAAGFVLNSTEGMIMQTKDGSPMNAGGYYSVSMPDVQVENLPKEDLRKLHEAAMIAHCALVDMSPLAVGEWSRSRSVSLIAHTRKLRTYQAWMDALSSGIVAESLGEGWLSLASMSGRTPLIMVGEMRPNHWHGHLNQLCVIADVYPDFDVTLITDGIPVQCSDKLDHLVADQSFLKSFQSLAGEFDFDFIRGELSQLLESEFFSAMAVARQRAKE